VNTSGEFRLAVKDEKDWKGEEVQSRKEAAGIRYARNHGQRLEKEVGRLHLKDNFRRGNGKRNTESST